MITCKKVIKYLNKIEDASLLIVFLFLFLIGLYGLYDSYLVYQNANDTSLLKYKPGYEGEAPDKPIVGNMVGWITLDDTKIDYPIMQGETNEDYLTVNPYGEYSMSGSIFLDYRNNENFTDEYNLVYGHHMDGGYMFGALDKYLGASYLKKHNTGTLIVGDNSQNKEKLAENTYNIEIFGIIETEATNEVIFAPNSYSKEEILKYVREHAVVENSDVLSHMDDNDRLIALSTCKYPDTVERTVLFGFIKTN